jgi:hypothetical protein
MLPGPGRALGIAGDLAVVVIEERGLAVIDVKHPEDPGLVGELELSGPGAAIATDGDIAFVAGFEETLVAVDLSRPDAPREVGRFPTTAPVVDLEVEGRCLFIATEDSLTQLDVSNPANMEVVAAVDAGEGIQDVGIGHNLMAVARHSDGVSIHEIGSCLCGFAPPRLFVPAAGSGAGAKDSSWSTDVVVNNAGDAPLRYELRFLARGVDNSGAVAAGPFELDPGVGVEYRDIVADMFGVAEGAGAIRFDALSDGTPLLASRTKSTDGDGATFGQGVPAVDSRDLFADRQRVRLLQLNEGLRFRTNIGFMSGSVVPITLQVEFRSGAGEFLASDVIELPPFGAGQWNQPLRRLGFANVVNGYADVWTDTAGALFTVYGSMIDNAKNDPTFIAPVEVR